MPGRYVAAPELRLLELVEKPYYRKDWTPTVLGYTGEMTVSHFRAAARLAFAARGVGRLCDGSLSAHGEKWRNGVGLREEIFDSVPGADVQRFRALEPEFWERMPLMADLGFRQTSLFHELIGTESPPARDSALLGAAFNLAITLIDHMVDDRKAGDRVFGFLDASLISNIFAAPEMARDQFGEAMRQAEDARERLVYSLVAFCASTGYRLLLESGNREAWKQLGAAIALLLDSERETASANWPNAAEARRLLPFIEAKSCMPSIATLQIALLAHHAPGIVSAPELMAAARWLGDLFWRVDDLVDLIEDLRSGTPNAIVIALADRCVREGRSFASDTDIYDELDAQAEQLMRSAQAPPVHNPDHRNALTRFALMLIAGWTGAGEISPPVSYRAAAEDALGHACSGALAFLLAQQADGYREAIHHLNFPRLLDQGVRYETRPSLLSHRAVILDALLDAQEGGLDCPSEVLAAESMAILRSKHRDVRGGWSYIQQAPELPPDADDLGQVLQVLWRFGGESLASICEEGLRLLLDSAEEDGSFCTWILDPRGRSFADTRMREYLGVMGGWGVHPEVVANLLYGLCLYDPVRYRDALHRSVRYLERAQDPAGFWVSKWYAGPFYGTWRSLSVLARIAPASDALGRAHRFLIASAHADGGWGENGSEPLSTALATLALCTRGAKAHADSVSRGVAYLCRTQRADDSWPSYPWISFPTVDGLVTHGSASVTTAFSLKAALAARQILGSGFEPEKESTAAVLAVEQVSE